jgi:hypothetical protein
MVTCFGIFIYAIIRPADMEVNFRLHCAKWDPIHCFNTLWTGDANLRLLRFCITTVKDR